MMIQIQIQTETETQTQKWTNKHTHNPSSRSLTYLFTSINNNNMFIAHTRIYPLLPFNSHYLLFLFFPTHLGFNGDFDQREIYNNNTMYTYLSFFVLFCFVLFYFSLNPPFIFTLYTNKETESKDHRTTKDIRNKREWWVMGGCRDPRSKTWNCSLVSCCWYKEADSA